MTCLFSKTMRYALLAGVSMAASGVYAGDLGAPELPPSTSLSAAIIQQDGRSNHATIDQQGAREQALIWQAQGSRGGDARIWQAGTGNTAAAVQNSSSDIAHMAQNGDHNIAVATQAGNNDTVNFTQIGSRNNVGALQLGNNDSVTYSQTGTGIINIVTQIGNHMRASASTVTP